MENRRIEALAVKNLEILALLEGRLDPKIPTGDKDPSFDGEIMIYDGSIENKKNLREKVPVQVKGTKVKNFNKKSRSFSVKLTDLQNYFRFNGVVLFVGEIRKSDKKVKFFYKELLPLELTRIIKELESRNTDQENLEGKEREKTIKLRQLSDITLNRMLRNFAREKKRQPADRVNAEKSKFNFENYQLTTLALESDNLFDAQFFLHGILDNTVTLPLSQCKIIEVGFHQDDYFKTPNDKMKANMSISYKKNAFTILIENTLHIDCSLTNKKNNLSLELRRPKNLKELKIAFSILKHLNSMVKCNFGERIILSLPNKLYSDSGLDNVLDLLNIVEEYLVDDLKVPFDTPIGDYSLETVLRGLTFFRDVYIKQDFSKTKLKNQAKPILIDFKLCDITVLLAYRPATKDLPQRLTNFYSSAIAESISATIPNKDGADVSIPPYIGLEQSTLERSANVDVKMTVSSTATFLDENLDKDLGTLETIHAQCLKFINAFDNTHRDELLECATEILSMIINKNPEAELIKINFYQCVKRKRKLTDEEKNEIYELKNKYYSNLECLFCISVLLDNKGESDYCFAQMSDEMKDDLFKLPIFTLYKNL
ncbi:DUF4365 domain-containing protein [Shouchella clausii]|uniref:hypothetical protein n=1 Tax=Shouchella clausii TaxID=79880 RepID=UPI002DB7C5EC|nr:hypothetical protein [Shouchella clausii]MEB5480757.1 DUF4365 domain-containing protein [Shouchella clausii]